MNKYWEFGERPIFTLKNCPRPADRVKELNILASFTGGTFMGKKHESNGQKKKLTKKELKAQNHAKLMANKGQNANVVDLNAYRDQNKKAA